jgi:hypothetical protein
MKKFTWIESYTTSAKYSAEISDEDAKLFEEDPIMFFETVDYQAGKELEWDDVSNDDESDHEVED